MTDDWQRHLPPEDHAEMIAELAQTPARHLDTITAAWRSTAEVYANPETLAALTRDAGVEPGGRTIAAYLPADVPEHVADRLFDQIADLIHATEHGQPYDIHLMGQAGDPLNIWTEPVEPFADTDLDGREARTTTLNADDYQRLLNSLDDADRAHEQAMRARKRGRAQT
jgi:hypothetical protein